MTNENENGIAIVGMSGRFPGAPDVATFWENVQGGRDTITHFSPDQLDIPPKGGVGKDYVCAKGILDDIDMFDAKFFGYLPKEAEVMDPQHRVFLEICWEAIEHAGYDAARYYGAVGVYGGCYMDTYLVHNLCSNNEFRQDFVESIQVGTLQTELGNDKDYLATRVAFKLGLRGPAMTLQTACSTSLVAIATACQSLETYGCDMALAGGVTIVLPQYKGYTYKEGSMLSPDGTCRPFDANAAGTVFSNGAAVLLLKRVEDAIADGDTIYAVIKGYATNNDGATKLSYTAPSVDGQADVISTALGMAGIDARTVGYVEAHGTATPLGDPIEVSGLSNAYRIDTADTQYCALGSVKANLGHLDVASGAIGLIKTSLLVHHNHIPALTHYSAPNPNIDFAASPFFIPVEPQDWSHVDGPRRAGVSSFGVGGTNAHVVVEQAPDGERPSEDQGPQVICLSAQSEAALENAAHRFQQAMSTDAAPALADAAYTLQIGRKEFVHRTAFVVDPARGNEDLTQSAEIFHQYSNGNIDDLVFLFPGQATQYPGMGRMLYHHYDVCREVIDRVAEIALAENPSIGDLRDLICWSSQDGMSQDDAAARVAQTALAQPVIFAIEVAVCKLYASWGITPSAVVGHSVGEIAAMEAAGILSFEDAARLAVVRGRLMQDQAPGSMLAVRQSAEDVYANLPEGLSVAGHNGPNITIVSGPTPAIQAYEKGFAGAERPPVRLRTSHAFHSAMMAPAREALDRVASDLRHNTPQVPVFSTLTGEHMNAAPAKSYWGEQLLSPVLFWEAIKEVNGRMPNAAFVEIGGGQVLSGLAAQCLPEVDEGFFVPSMGPAGNPGDDRCHVLLGVGQLWTLGYRPDWTALHGTPRRRVPLPTYPFERKRYWVEPTTSVEASASSAQPAASAPQNDIAALIQNQLQIVSAQMDALQNSRSGRGKE